MALAVSACVYNDPRETRTLCVCSLKSVTQYYHNHNDEGEVCSVRNGHCRRPWTTTTTLTPHMGDDDDDDDNVV